MKMKGQLHTHTVCSDGNLSPQQMADIYEALGFHFIAFTDHDHLFKPHTYRLYNEVRTPILILHGIELTVHCRKGYVHVSRIDGQADRLFIFNHPAEYHLSPKEIRECIDEISECYPLDGVEVTHHGFYTPQFDLSEIPYPKVAADDAHDQDACGRGWIELDCDRNADAIIAAIRQGSFQNGFAGKAIQARLHPMQLA